MQTSPGLQGQPRLPERRRPPTDRRLGDRRLRSIPVLIDRRHGGDRRRPLERREGPSGHIRNALQMIAAVLQGDVTGDDATAALHGAIDRLWRALPEVDRLHDSCRVMGGQIRKQESESEEA